MKTIILVFIILSSSVIFGQSREVTLQKMLDTVISKSKEVSYYTKTVNWKILSAKMRKSAKNAKTLDDLKPAFKMLLNELRDHHGTIRAKSGFPILANFTDFKNSRHKNNRIYTTEIWKIINDLEARYEYALLPNKIGYLKIVGIGPNLDGQKEAERIRNSLIELCKKNVHKWIIDLRYNGGGNVNVMLAGIAPLLDTKTVVKVLDRNKNIQFTGEIIKNDFWYAGLNAFKIGKKPTIKNPKIAILTSRWTTSSGEFVAVAFKGQKNTRFFGEKTEGKTTNNGWEIINDEIVLSISTGVYCDRNSNVYAENVQPDKEIPFVVEKNKEKDTGIIEAIKWLRGK